MSVAPDDLSFLQRLSGGVDRATAPFGGAGNLGLALLANSGYSTTPRTFGQTLGVSALQAQQAQQEKANNDLRRQYMEAQIQQMQQPKERAPPASVAEYEYAKQSGFKGSFQDWVVAGGQSSRPSAVQEWEFYTGLPPEMQQRYLEMKRNPNMVVKEIAGTQNVVAPSIVGGTKVTPLSTLAQEAGAAERLKGAEAEGGAVGKARGEVTGGIITKGSNAKSTMSSLDIADPLIDVATGSAAGAARDKVAAFFGEAPSGAQAIAQLKVLQANLMTTMPRMEGPQSDRDVQLYREAAGQIGDPMVPAAIKKAAVKTIRSLQEKYVARAEGIDGSAPKKRRYNPATGKIE